MRGSSEVGYRSSEVGSRSSEVAGETGRLKRNPEA